MQEDLDQIVPWPESKWGQNLAGDIKQLHQTSAHSDVPFAELAEDLFGIMVRKNATFLDPDVERGRVCAHAIIAALKSEQRRNVSASADQSRSVPVRHQVDKSAHDEFTGNDDKSSNDDSAASKSRKRSKPVASSEGTEPKKRTRHVTGNDVYECEHVQDRVPWVFVVKHTDGETARKQMGAHFREWFLRGVKSGRIIRPENDEEAMRVYTLGIDDWSKRFLDSPPLLMIRGSFGSSTKNNFTKLMKEAFETVFNRPASDDKRNQFLDYQYQVWSETWQHAKAKGATQEDAMKAGQDAAEKAKRGADEVGQGRDDYVKFRDKRKEWRTLIQSRLSAASDDEGSAADGVPPRDESDEALGTGATAGHARERSSGAETRAEVNSTLEEQQQRSGAGTRAEVNSTPPGAREDVAGRAAAPGPAWTGESNPPGATPQGKQVMSFMTIHNLVFTTFRPPFFMLHYPIP